MGIAGRGVVWTVKHGMTVLLMFLMVVVLSGCSAGMGTSGLPPGQHAMRLEKKVTTTHRLNYLLHLPDGYAASDEPLPLMLFLHGAGERGDDLELVKKHGPPKLIAAGKSFPFIVVSPQCPIGEWWSPEPLIALLDEVSARFRVDPGRVYLTGLSMGGYGSWDLLQTCPGRFAAAAPICGGGIPYLARTFADVPVWAFHGAKDEVVPVENSRLMVEALRKSGGEARLTVYPEAGHDSWTGTYDNPELYEWLLGHRREP